MNKKNLIIEVLLAVAVVVVFILQFNGKEEKKAEEKKVETLQEASSMNVAYIKTDSLILHYKLARKLENQFADQKRESQRQLEQRMNKFQKNYQAFQEKVQRGGFLSQASAEAQQQELLTEQQQLEQLNQKLNSDLMAKEQRIYQELYDSITSYVNHFNRGKKYDFILSHTAGGAIIFGKERYNITGEILSGLNARFEKREAAE
jgi:outer membrane protein